MPGRKYIRRYAPKQTHVLNQKRAAWVYGTPRSAVEPKFSENLPELMQNWPVIVNATSLATTPFGGSQGWFVNGGGHSVSISSTLPIIQTVSVACWFLVSSNRNYWVFLKGDSTNNADFSFTIADFTGTLKLFVSNGTSTVVADSGLFLADAMWHRVVGTIDGTTANIYIDGKLCGSVSQSGSMPTSPSHDWGFGLGGVIGAIDYAADMSIWTRALSATEVAQDYLHAITGYTRADSPMNLNDSHEVDIGIVQSPANFTTSVGVSQAMQFASPARFVTTLFPSVAAGGIGPPVPDGPADFDTQVGVGQQFVAGQPTLVNFNTTVGVAEDIAAGSPIEFETSIAVKQSIRSIANGDKRRLNDGHYRR